MSGGCVNSEAHEEVLYLGIDDLAGMQAAIDEERVLIIAFSPVDRFLVELEEDEKPDMEHIRLLQKTLIFGIMNECEEPTPV